jgi:hypothetical protein
MNLSNIQYILNTVIQRSILQRIDVQPKVVKHWLILLIFLFFLDKKNILNRNIQRRCNHIISTLDLTHCDCHQLLSKLPSRYLRPN